MISQNKGEMYFTTRELVFTALMTAFVFTATYLPHIPIPLGYAHLGDAVIFALEPLDGGSIYPRRSGALR